VLPSFLFSGAFARPGGACLLLTAQNVDLVQEIMADFAAIHVELFAGYVTVFPAFDCLASVLQILIAQRRADVQHFFLGKIHHVILHLLHPPFVVFPWNIFIILPFR
jgi:predicted metal-binding membrane protein